MDIKSTTTLLTALFLTTSLYGFGQSALAGDEKIDAKHHKQNKLLCYKWSAFPNERLKLNIKYHSDLTEDPEECKFGHAYQVAYSVHGKHVGMCGGNTMSATTGTIVTGYPLSNTTGPTGSHLSITTGSVRGGSGDSCRPVNFDCTTNEQTSGPKIWTCYTRNEFDVFHGSSTLTQVDETRDPRCSVFENGSFDGVETMEGTGSGFKGKNSPK